MDRHRLGRKNSLSEISERNCPRGPRAGGARGPTAYMNWLQNLRILWPGALRQQVTRTGLLYSAAIVLVTVAAVLSANNLLFLILAAMLSILGVSGFVSKLTLAGLE